MEKILDATYDGEVFRPDEPLDLKPNTKAKIIVEDEIIVKDEPKKLKLVEMPKKGKSEPYAFLKFARSVNIDAPPDYSVNFEEYLYHGKSFDDE